MAASGQAKQTPPPAEGHTADSGNDAGKRVQVTADVHPTETAGKEHSAEAGGGAGRHEVLCRQLLELLDKEHHAYVKKEGLSMENEPEKSYLKGFSDIVTRAVERKKDPSL